MPSDHIKLTRQEGLAVITLDRPEARNALSPEMLAELGRALDACRSPQVRAVLLTGTGEAFCAGADVKDMVQQLEQGGPQALSRHLRSLADALHRGVILPIRRLAKPVVAGVNGVAAGAGFSLMLACDFRVASERARFLMAYAGIGAAPDGGATHLLPRLAGGARALEVYLASQPYSAPRALELGLVSQVFPAEGFDRHALEVSLRLAQGPTAAYAQAKALFDAGGETTLEAQLDAEAEAIARLALTRDFQEGIRAFAQKRLPWFEGR
ncbi:MAG: enoyl-CoA hydratase [Dehalococcoidia bacterium]|nr:enoyl-CoA hydratase [Dehalococcoidia bacterium]MSQ17395.1 enoyl-CoA hydratase [Dehalococcoidia bacterium]